MAKVNIKVSSALQSKLDKVMLETKRELAKKARDTLVGAASDAMKTFYEHYTPKSYKRTNGFRDKSYIGVYKNPHNSRIYGGVRITTDNIDSDNYITFEQVNGKWTKTEISSSPVPTNETIPQTMGDIRELVYNGYHGKTEIFKIINPKLNVSIPPKMTESPYEIIERIRNEFISEIKTKGYANNIAIKFWK